MICKAVVPQRDSLVLRVCTLQYDVVALFRLKNIAVYPSPLSQFFLSRNIRIDLTILHPPKELYHIVKSKLGLQRGTKLS